MDTNTLIFFLAIVNSSESLGFFVAVTTYKDLYELSSHIGLPSFPGLVYDFLLNQIYPDHSEEGAKAWQEQVKEGCIPKIGRAHV